ncbi:hypothetical protein [Barnesiella sp. An55]|uniref:hypothetical protein n=1 Tax=Barnesiella sp. An55 TaxID=1965646 RepID=UPI000B55DBAC|nr:hypothetical protein [Barnesiella sp. An55]OUN72989.1 hypothetical protein B5G10_05840 [Barnesiella sp. An55]
MNQLLTPCIVQTIVICCTVIVIALVLLSGYRIKKQQEQSWQGYIFISSILTILAIIILSYIFYGDRNVLDFVSLASALISIILAIITIIYSFYSNSRSSGQVEKSQEAAEKIREAAEKVQVATKAYSESAGSLQFNIQKILNKIDHVESNTNEIRQNFYNVSDEKVSQSVSKMERFVKQSSKMGTMALYAGILSKDNNKKFRLSVLGQNQNESYCAGYLIATSCINYIEVQLIVEDNLLYVSVDSYDHNLKDNINKEIAYYLTDKDVSSEDKEFYTSVKEKIDQYFCDTSDK